MYEASGVIAAQLHKGEEVLWSGEPDTRMVFSTGDIALVPASPLWAAMAVYFSAELLAAASIDSTAAPFVLFFAVPFTLMAFYATVGRFVFRRWVKSRTHYAVTNERVMDLTRIFGETSRPRFSMRSMK
jgi:hypothetical protein